VVRMLRIQLLESYGTGAIMAVPAHDSRDYEFALKYDIPVIRVVIPIGENYEDGKPYTDDGIMINSSSSVTGLNINGLSSKQGASKVLDWLDSTGQGKKMVNYKLRNWLFARQRYWGEPFPVIYSDETGETVPIPENELPLTLPELDDFTPTGTGEPPLAKAVSWVCLAKMLYIKYENIVSVPALTAPKTPPPIFFFFNF